MTTRFTTLAAALILSVLATACGPTEAPTEATTTSPAPHTTAAQHRTDLRIDALEDRLDDLETRRDDAQDLPTVAARPERTPLMLDDAPKTTETPKRITPPKRLAAANTHDDDTQDLPITPSDLKLVEQTMATDVTDRVPQGRSDAFNPSDKTLWAWVKVRNDGDAPSRITMTWKREGEVRSTVHLDVGVSKGWRTWSRKSINRRDVGRWSVEVTNPEGDRLGTINFTVDPEPTSALINFEEPGC